MGPGFLQSAKAGAKAIVPDAALRLYRTARINHRLRNLGRSDPDWMALRHLSRLIGDPNHASRYDDPRHFAELIARAEPAGRCPCWKIQNL